MHEITRNFASVLEEAVRRDERMKIRAASVFQGLSSDGEDELTAFWLRSHIFGHGLFGHKERSKHTFISAAEAEASARKMCSKWRDQHLGGQLISCRWDLQPVFTMLDVGVWDEECRAAADAMLDNNQAVVAFSLMLYGNYFSTDKETISNICSYDSYIARVSNALESQTDNLDESARLALKKALSGGW
jgi:hypothetical protein